MMRLWHRWKKGHWPELFNVEVTADGRSWHRSPIRLCSICWPTVADNVQTKLAEHAQRYQDDPNYRTAVDYNVWLDGF